MIGWAIFIKLWFSVRWNSKLRVNILTQAKSGSRAGNRITANRWSRIFRQWGHAVRITDRLETHCDLVIAIHAEKSAHAVIEYQKAFPSTQIIVVVSGTDIYGKSHLSKRAVRSLQLCDVIVTLEDHARHRLPPTLRAKAVTIHQSATPLSRPQPSLKSCLEICVCGHLRKEKNPFLVVKAAEQLPEESRIRFTHIGSAMSRQLQKQAQKYTNTLKRYRWLGGKEHWRARQLIGRSQLMVNSSLMESSANSVVESLVLGTPVLATDVPGNVGVFGADYPGLYPSNDSGLLARLLYQFEHDKRFRRHISKICLRLASQFSPAIEKNAWKKVLRGLR